MCHQTAALVQRALEGLGIVSVSLSVLPEITVRCRPSRALLLEHPLGYTLGEPGDAAGRVEIVRAALALLRRGDTPLLEPYSTGTKKLRR